MFFIPLFVFCWNVDPGTGIKKKIRIRGEPPGSATLVTSLCFGAGQAGAGESRGDVNSSERQVFFLFLYVRYSFLLISNKFGDLSLLRWAVFMGVLGGGGGGGGSTVRKIDCTVLTVQSIFLVGAVTGT